ncbi:transporter substrate-binding domain-containing protein [Fundidesulfovibrio agrisoli]|uniref:transporter substrate-binding domain-containing protein n=1 Tax=Fundidesulfovibrio agrisoli TaxID=2922717 RepID=UPI001FADD5B6|nr:transporter substrate-binding domain-containing protein [Fundidesulfovibrio agrisoli]
MKIVSVALLILLQTVLYSGQALAEKLSIYVQSDQHLAFAREICIEALNKAGLDATFEMFPVAAENRLDAEMASGKLHLSFIPPNANRLALEGRQLIAAIRVPLERGLLGWRVCLVRGNDKDILKGVTSVEALRRFRVGQGYGWGDIDVYAGAGITVVEAPFSSQSAPLRALASGHFDLLPMGTSEFEAFLERAKEEGLGIVADSHIVIHYPWFRFIWVSRTAPNAAILLESLERGLDIMVRDGSFIRIFEQYKGKIDTAWVRRRTMIELASPYAQASDIPAKYRHLLIDPR